MKRRSISNQETANPKEIIFFTDWTGKNFRETISHVGEV